MPDGTETEETTQTTTEHVEEPPKETPPQADPEKEQLRRELANKDREVQGAQAYLQNLLATMRAAAERPSGGSSAPVDERSLAERLAENPEAVLDEHFRVRMNPIVQAYLNNQDMQNRELARERITRDKNLEDADGVSFWDKYEKEIDQFMSGMPPEVKARPGAYERALKFVMAEHIDEVAEARATKIAKQREARERGAFVEGPTGAAPRSRAPEGLTSLEKEVAKGLGMSEKDFLEAKKMDQFGHSGGS